MPPVWLFRDEAASVAVCKMLRCLQSKNHPGAKRTRRGNSSFIDLTCYRLVPWASSASPREFGTCAVSCTFLSPAAFGRREQSPSGTEAVPTGCTDRMVLGGEVQGKALPSPKQVWGQRSSFVTLGQGQDHPREMLLSLGLGSAA